MSVFFNDTATTEIYTLSLHDALPILQFVNPLQHVEGAVDGRCLGAQRVELAELLAGVQHQHDGVGQGTEQVGERDRKSTRLNSSHANISYAVFCLKKNTTITHYLLDT